MGLICDQSEPMRKLAAAELHRLTLEAYQSSGRMPVTVVLDNIRSGHNTGAIFRTCDAFGIESLYLCGITPCPPNREILKTALGSTSSVSWCHFPDAKKALEKLKEQQSVIVMAEHTTGSTALQDFRPLQEKKYAIVFGNEVEGIQSDLLPLADQVLEIPQFGTKHSFNVSVAAGIILWDVWNKLR